MRRTELLEQVVDFNDDLMQQMLAEEAHLAPEAVVKAIRAGVLSSENLPGALRISLQE